MTLWRRHKERLAEIPEGLIEKHNLKEDRRKATKVYDRVFKQPARPAGYRMAIKPEVRRSKKELRA